MSKNRQVQHRPEREKARGKELVAAKQEAKQLKRLVSRLQKTIRKLEDERGVQVQLEEASPEPVVADVKAVVIQEPDADRCSRCGLSAWSVFTTPGGKTISSCRNCKTRR